MTPPDQHLIKLILESEGWRFVPSHDVAGIAVPDCWVHNDNETVWERFPFELDDNLLDGIVRGMDDKIVTIYYDCLIDVAGETITQYLTRVTRTQKARAILKARGVEV